MLKQTLHYQLSQIVKELYGIDYSSDVIKKIKENNEFSQKFSNIIFGNAEDLDQCKLDEKFEVIVVGDFIKHLSNPGNLMLGLKRFCTPNTSIILTTPNAFGIGNFLRYIFNRFEEGNEHVMTFNLYNIQNLCMRYNFAIQNTYTCYQSHSKQIHFFPILKFFLAKISKLGGTLLFVIKYNF